MDDRTQIAAMAMQGMLANNKRGPNTFGQYPHEYEPFAAAAVSLADALIAALREPPLDTLTAEAQEAGKYDQVGDWRKYAKKTDDLYIRRIASGCYRGSDVDRAFAWACTPQDHDFWVRVALATATPAEEARARDFARRVLEAMEKEDD